MARLRTRLLAVWLAALLAVWPGLAVPPAAAAALLPLSLPGSRVGGSSSFSRFSRPAAASASQERRPVQPCGYDGHASEVSNYLIDPLTANVWSEYDTAGALSAKNVHSDGTDELLARLQGGVNYQALQDGLGSITGLTDAAGAVVTGYSYGAWGARTQTSGTLSQPFGFAGREHEGDQVYVRARYLMPGIGRWNAADPIDLLGGDVNLHRYVRGNPINLTDPSGTNPLLVGIMIGMAAGALTGAAFDIVVQTLLNISVGDHSGVKWGQVGKSAILGAAGGAVTAEAAVAISEISSIMKMLRSLADKTQQIKRACKIKAPRFNSEELKYYFSEAEEGTINGGFQRLNRLVGILKNHGYSGADVLILVKRMIGGTGI